MRGRPTGTKIPNADRQKKGDMGEGSQLQFPHDVLLHLSELPGHGVGRPAETEEEGEGVPLLLAPSDEAEGLLDTLSQVLERAAHGGTVHRRLRLLIMLLENSGDSRHAPLDLAALLVVLLHRLHGLLDLERGLDDLPQAPQCDVGHLARSCGVDRDDLQGHYIIQENAST